MLVQHKIEANHVAVIATATLRSISNADEFNRRALPPLVIQLKSSQACVKLSLSIKAW